MAKQQTADQRISKRQRDELREPMLANDVPLRVIKDEMVRRWGLRPRQAWRFAHGWSLDAMAAAYNARHDTTGRSPMSASRISGYERWPHKGERPTAAMLCSLAELFDTTLDQIIDAVDWTHLSEVDRRTIQDRMSAVTGAIPSSPAADPSTAYRYKEEADNTGEVVTLAAHEGSEHAGEAERREVGDATLEQLRADVARVSHEYMTSNPFPLFQEMRRIRRRIYRVLDRKVWPRDETDLYFLLGVLNGLMAVAAHSLGNDPAAEELLRSGWAYATAIDHRPLKGQLRLELSKIASWERPHQSRDLARSGLEFQPAGPYAVQLHLQHGRAAARLGDVDTARRAIAAARDISTADYHDEVLEIGGEFALSQATLQLATGSALLEIPGAGNEAASVLEQAVQLYEAGPGPGEHHYYGAANQARINLASARLRSRELDAAVSDLEPVLSLPPVMRTAGLVRRFNRIRSTLVTDTYLGEALAGDLDERIETFIIETTADLGELSSGT